MEGREGQMSPTAVVWTLVVAVAGLLVLANLYARRRGW